MRHSVHRTGEEINSRAKAKVNFNPAPELRAIFLGGEDNHRKFITFVLWNHFYKNLTKDRYPPRVISISNPQLAWITRYDKLNEYKLNTQFIPAK